MPEQVLKKSEIKAALLVAFIAFAVYLPSLQNRFVNFDDYDFVLRNPYIQHFDFNLLKWSFLDFFQGNWHPLTWLAFAADYAVWGLDPFGYHLTNILFHSFNSALSVILIFALMRYRLIYPSVNNFYTDFHIWVIALSTGILFAIHPLHVESVAWVSERKDVLCAFFFLLSLIAYIKYSGNMSFRWYSFSIGFFILSLLSKQMTVTLPLILLVLDRYPLKRFETENIKNIIAEKIPFFALSIITAVVTYIAHLHGKDIVTFREISIYPRLLTASRAFIEYIRKMLWPSDLSPFYPYPSNINSINLSSPEYLIPFILFLMLAASCILLAKKNRTWTSAWAYYFVILLPVIGIIKTGDQAMADRYTYLPSIGPFFLFSAGLVWFIKKLPVIQKNNILEKVAFCAVILSMLVLLSLLTTRQIAVWQDSGTLWGKVIEFEPEYPGGYDKRGRYYIETGDYAKAFQDFNRGIGTGKNKTDVVELYMDRASLFFSLKQFENAVADISVVLQYGTNNWYPYFLRGESFFMLGEYSRALPDLTEAIKYNPLKWELYYERARVYKKLDFNDKSFEDIRIARKLHDKSKQFRQ